ncbi:MAG: radical SAM/SPASM domain-containing protein [Gammaproteobacteria bacterium]
MQPESYTQLRKRYGVEQNPTQPHAPLMKKYYFGIVAVTYTCNARCDMCYSWKNPTKKADQITPEDLMKLPDVPVYNVTGGEAFVRPDIQDLLAVLDKKCDRIVVSSNGAYTDKIVDTVKKFPKVGIRVSLEGLQKANDEIRGIPDGFDTGLRTILALAEMGHKDIGFGMTISHKNYKDLGALHELAERMEVEFATASLHNSFYFHKMDNQVDNLPEVIAEVKKLIKSQLKSKRPKDWYRAYFNFGLANYMMGKPRVLPCEMGFSAFYVDPYGNVRPCNVMDEKIGNIKTQSWDDIWHSEAATAMRNKVLSCKESCWMTGSVFQMMKKYIGTPTRFIADHKFLGKDLDETFAQFGPPPEKTQHGQEIHFHKYDFKRPESDDERLRRARRGSKTG